ncbi:MAG: hypothetical protein KC422_25420, partial [Trueperaceae bacterium]|nr:hypothetical protein [Trueperaceae bacterium]
VLMQDNSIRLAKAWDRRVIGSMTDQAKHLQFYLEDEGGLAAATIPALMMRINRMPMKKTSATNKAGGYIFPSDEIRNVLGHAY